MKQATQRKRGPAGAMTRPGRKVVGKLVLRRLWFDTR